jgi:hypothetical protein
MTPSALVDKTLKMANAWRRHFLQFELAVVACCTALLTMWTVTYGGQGAMRELMDGRRATIYGTIAGIEASLLGFTIATAAIVLGFTQNQRFELLRRSRHYSTLWNTFTSGIRALACAALATLVALVVDRERHPSTPAMLVCIGFLLLSAVRVARIIWVLERIISIIAHRIAR